MPASNETIQGVIDRYISLVATGTGTEILALYADGATVEDPVGSTVLSTSEEILAFYATLDDLDQKTRLVASRVCAGEAVFHFEVVTTMGEQTFTLAPFDVMTFDEAGLITSMRAYWSDQDMVIS